jgi:hypothetical protein
MAWATLVVTHMVCVPVKVGEKQHAVTPVWEAAYGEADGMIGS